MSNIGFTTQLTVNDGVSGSSRPFLEPVTVTFPSYEGSAVETTGLQNSSRIRSYISGMIDPGKLEGEMRFNVSDYARLTALINNAAIYTITSPVDQSSSTASLSFPAILLKADTMAEAADVMNIKIEAKVVGAITYTF